jgi:hypothetical protein
MARLSRGKYMKGISRRYFMRMAAQITTTAGMTTISPVSFVGSKALAGVRDDHPNVLFVAIDDINTNISAFADSAVKTPHMEASARHGVAFDHAGILKRKNTNATYYEIQVSG